MKELVVATGNMGKLREMELLLQGSVTRLLSPVDFPLYPEVVEDGKTFAENAVKKARCASLATKKPALADDSGLVVDTLGGLPGVHSARFAGEKATDVENNIKLIAMLSGVPLARRTAAFHCVIALCMPNGDCMTFDGDLKGVILNESRGSGGFGYDPFFLVPEYDQTLAELSLSVKNEISHRGKAFAKLKDYLQGQKPVLVRVGF
jgi:XTP/dITP diphosphohydrolase